MSYSSLSWVVLKRECDDAPLLCAGAYLSGIHQAEHLSGRAVTGEMGYSPTSAAGTPAPPHPRPRGSARRWWIRPLITFQGARSPDPPLLAGQEGAGCMSRSVPSPWPGSRVAAGCMSRRSSSALAGRRDHMIFERIGALRSWSNSCSSRVALLTASAALPGRASRRRRNRAAGLSVAGHSVGADK